MATDSKARSREFFQFIDADQGKTVPSLLSTSFVAHVAGMPDMDGPTFSGFGAAFYAAFPDLRHSVEDQVAEGDTVVTRLTVTGTHQAPFQGIPATGRRVSVPTIVTHRFQNDQIVEAHLLFDAMGLMQQLGVIPTPDAATA